MGFLPSQANYNDQEPAPARVTSAIADGRRTARASRSSARMVTRLFVKSSSWLLVDSTRTPPLRYTVAAYLKAPTSAVPAGTAELTTVRSPHTGGFSRMPPLPYWPWQQPPPR